MGLVTTRERPPPRRYGPETNALNPRPRTERGGSEGSPLGVTRPLTLIPIPARPKPCVDWPATQEQPSLASAEIGWVRYGAPHTPLVSSLIPRRAGSQACRRPYPRRVASRGLDVGDRPYRRGGNRAEGIPPASPGDSRGTLNFLSCHSGGRELVHLTLPYLARMLEGGCGIDAATGTRRTAWVGQECVCRSAGLRKSGLGVATGLVYLDGILTQMSMLGAL